MTIGDKIGQHDKLDARHLSQIDAGLIIPSILYPTSLYVLIHTLYPPFIEIIRSYLNVYHVDYDTRIKVR